MAAGVTIRNGKYKGKPYDMLLEDKRYCAWLLRAPPEDLPANLRHIARRLECEKGGVLFVGAHKHSFYKDVCDQSPDYALWASELSSPGDGIKSFAEYARKKRARDSEPEPEEKPAQARNEATSGAGDQKCCVVCLDRGLQACFVPCGHVVTCMICALRVERDGCPTCRSSIAMVQKIYL